MPSGDGCWKRFEYPVIREYVYTLEETANFMGVYRSTVYRWLKAGKLPGEEIGGAVLISRWAVEMLKAEREAKGRTQS